MAIDPDDPLAPVKKAQIALGEDISTLSAFELEARIHALETEIARCRTAIAARGATRAAADAFFKKG